MFPLTETIIITCWTHTLLRLSKQEFGRVFVWQLCLKTSNLKTKCNYKDINFRKQQECMNIRSRNSRKDRQIQWPKEKTNNTMAKRKKNPDNTMIKRKKKQTIQWSKEKQPHKTMGKRKKKTNNGPQNTTQKTKDRNTNPTKTDGEVMCSGRVTVPAPIVTTIMLLLNDTNKFVFGNRVRHQDWVEITLDTRIGLKSR